MTKPATDAPPAAEVDPRRLLLIVNPHAGGGRGARALPDVSATLRRWASDVRVERTRDIDHAADLAGQAVADGRVAVALGGDGLAGRVAETVAHLGGLLAVLPGGRGNDFLRTVGACRDPVIAATALASSVERRIDLAEANGRAYLGIASVGFDSDVQVIANRTRFVRGQQVYTYGALRAAAAWKPARFTVEIDDGAPHELVGWTVAAANSAYYGGGMRLAPGARLDDGLLDVVLLSQCGKVTFLSTFPKVFSGRHVDSAHVEVRPARSIRVDADRPFQLYADGDPIADLPARIVLRPGMLRFLAPQP
ncbi:diacylglycerol/lipid kinase family protein [Protofrankia symbiont of Coriaria ruscifolia]|uniref:diacylglycerol/lipid kinase family protein n=1 Tax=Protofrankia symbiont of Coriaria ruscifolia TaxID=1306542 RepID=UPI0010419B49|nr:diacylglycerol kinase family protein [Protofrankia symbiont of Coriaria ruscifolia]